MNLLRDRAKEHFPTVLLTLLSIVQALALELLWSHLHEVDYLYELSWISAISWIQIVATVTGIILIWVVYSGNVMRFRWVPATSESVYPFFIGLTEFMLIETLGPNQIGLWLIFMAVVFGLMHWVTHMTMRRARLDVDNSAFFAASEPAQLRDFYPGLAIVGGLMASGLYLLASPESRVFVIFALLATNGALGWQFYQAAKFWDTAVAEDAGES